MQDELFLYPVSGQRKLLIVVCSYSKVFLNLHIHSHLESACLHAHALLFWSKGLSEQLLHSCNIARKNMHRLVGQNVGNHGSERCEMKPLKMLDFPSISSCFISLTEASLQQFWTSYDKVNNRLGLAKA